MQSFSTRAATLAATAAIAAQLSLPAVARAQELTTLNILVANERATSEYPIFVADELGFYEEEGLEVNYLPSATTVPYIAFLANQQAELVMLDPSQVLQAVSAQQPISIIYEYMQAAPEALMVPESSDIRTITDLKGKTIGMASDRDQVTVNVSLDSVGMSPDDVSTVVVGDSLALVVNQLTTGAIDAYAGGSNETSGIEHNGVPLRYLTPPVISQQPGNSMVIWSPRKEELREPIWKFLRAWNKASTAALLDVEAVAAMAKKTIPEQWEEPDLGQAVLDQSIYSLLLQRTRLRGEPQPDVWAKLQEPYLKLGTVSETYDPATFTDSSFIEPAMDYTTEEVKAALAKWREENADLLQP